jgi:ribosomal protein S18 acetylase RimI-like enzyme
VTIVRSAQNGDIPCLTELYSREVQAQLNLAGSFQLVRRVDWTAYVTARIRHIQTEVLVAEKDSRIVGFLEARISGGGAINRLKSLMFRLTLLQEKNPTRYGYIEEVYVVPASRRQGVARMLIEGGIRWLKERGAREVAAGVWVSNRASLELFEKMGFAPTGLLMTRGLIPADGMCRIHTCCS